MKILVCIDDTDNMEKGRGTGKLAEELSAMITDRRWGRCEKITRHQLLIHEDIPYTSHNSSMCFRVELDGQYLQDFIQAAGEYLDREHAPESDPGLCVAVEAQLKSPQKLIDFGWMAKKEVLNKEMARKTADETGVHLSEHGGTGLGIIGALAGIGLRLSGNDGEFKGNVDIAQENDILTVSEICSNDGIDRVMNLQGDWLGQSERIRFGRFKKTVQVGGEAVLLVAPFQDTEGTTGWITCSKKQLREFDHERII